MIILQQDSYLDTLNYNMPTAYAYVFGGKNYPELHGTVLFYVVPGGVLVYAQVIGLPIPEKTCGSITDCDTPTCSPDIFGFHIHEGGVCNGSDDDPFSETGSHYNPGHCPHPEHAGDLPPLFGNNGFAWSVFYTDRFSISDIIGKTVVIHAGADDFTSQPSGDSGAKIGCGEITLNTSLR